MRSCHVRSIPPITGPCFERSVTVPSGAIFSMPYFRVTKTLSLLSTTMYCGVETDPDGRVCVDKLIGKNIATNSIKYFIGRSPYVDLKLIRRDHPFAQIDRGTKDSFKSLEQQQL